MDSNNPPKYFLKTHHTLHTNRTQRRSDHAYVNLSSRARNNLWQRRSTQMHIQLRLWRNTIAVTITQITVTNVTIIKRTHYEYYHLSFHFTTKLWYLIFFFVIYILTKCTKMINEAVTNKLLTRYTPCSIRPIVKWDLVAIVFSQYFSNLLNTDCCRNIIWNSPWF